MEAARLRDPLASSRRVGACELKLLDTAPAPVPPREEEGPGKLLAVPGRSRSSKEEPIGVVGLTLMESRERREKVARRVS